MAPSWRLPLQYFLLFTLLTLSQVTATTLETTVTTTAAATHSPAPPPQTFSHELHENSFFSHTALLAPILTSLFQRARHCGAVSLRERRVFSLYTIDYLRKLAFGTKTETLSPGRCQTVTSTSFRKPNVKDSNDAVKVFIDGVEITRPEPFNNGLNIIHGVQGYVAPLSPFERLNSLTFPLNEKKQQMTDRFSSRQQFLTQSTITQLMLGDAMSRLRNNGSSILSLMRVKYDLEKLPLGATLERGQMATSAAAFGSPGSVRVQLMLGDAMLRLRNNGSSILSLMRVKYDLEKLPLGASLPTLERGQSLMATAAAFGSPGSVPNRCGYKVVLSGQSANANLASSGESGGAGDGQRGDGADGGDAAGGGGDGRDVHQPSLTIPIILRRTGHPLQELATIQLLGSTTRPQMLTLLHHQWSLHAHQQPQQDITRDNVWPGHRVIFRGLLHPYEGHNDDNYIDLDFEGDWPYFLYHIEDIIVEPL